MPLAPGTTIGRYRIESRIGGGAMGVVYLAVDTRLERRVALKLIEPSLAADPNFRARFEREARAAAGLDHPHVLPVYEAGEDDDQLYLAMRYVPGTDLATQLARHGPLDLAATTRLVSQLAAALDAAHASGLIHRDVKPANVLLAPDQHAYLADFGLARSASTGITRPGQLVGTADYTAPELLASASASAASDTYALACLAVECLTGRPPFTRDGELATLYAHANDPIPDLSDQLPLLPPGLQAVFERGLAKDPAARYPSAGELAAALVDAGAADSTPPRSRSRLKTRMVSGRWLLMGAAATVVAIPVLAAALIGTMPRQNVASKSSSPSAAIADTESSGAGPSAVAKSTQAAYPTSNEERVLSLLDASIRGACERAAPEDGPALLFTTERIPVPFDAAIRCPLGGISAPDDLWYWDLRLTDFPADTDEVVWNVASRVGARPRINFPVPSEPPRSRSCAGELPAIEPWSFGDATGTRVCYLTATGDAVAQWTVEGTDFLVKAVRDDADMTALLDWWLDEGRFWH